MSNVINFMDRKGRELTDDEKVLDNGVTLEYLCNKHHSVSVHEITVDGHSKLFAVADISAIEPFYTEGICTFGVFEKGQTLHTGLYFLTTYDDFTNPDFLEDKDLVSEYVFQYCMALFPNSVIEVQ